MKISVSGWWPALCERVREQSIVQDYIIHKRLRAIRRDYARHEEAMLREHRRFIASSAKLDEFADQFSMDMYERKELELEMHIEHSNFLTHIARQRQISYPDYSDPEARAAEWLQDDVSKRVYLKPREQALLLLAIRKDLKEEAEAFRSWASFGLGLFGAVTGGLALLLKIVGVG